MGRRSKSNAQGLMDLVSLLPWWAGVGLACAGYVVLHSMATAPVPVLTPGEPVAKLVAPMIVRSLAMAGQFVVPLLCLVGAAVSFVRRRRRAALVQRVESSTAADVLSDMSWQEFEMLVGEAFRVQGYSVEEKGGPVADGGVDLVLRKRGEKYLVQCKQWKALKVDVRVVRELFGLMAAEGASGGYVVTSGRFTGVAVAFAKGRNLHLLDGAALLAMIQQARASQPFADTQPSELAA